MLDIKENLARIQFEAQEAFKRSGRKDEEMILLGATKTVTPERIQEAVDAGLLYIGENRVQELCEKFGHVQNAHWHFIGHLQTNKVRQIIGKAELIHAVDSEHLLDEIEKQAIKHNLCAHVLLEINASGEETKFGITHNEARLFIENNEQREHLKIDGLMTIGPNTRDEYHIRQCFHGMRSLFESLKKESYRNTTMRYLSMGMSGDYIIALEEGSNIVRIGSAIFGYREWR